MTDKKQIRHKALGVTFYLKKVEQAMLLMALSEADRPKPPIVPVTYAGGVETTEPNPSDPKYLEDLELWHGTHNARLFRVCVVYGVDRIEHADGTPVLITPEEESEIRFVYGEGLPRSAVEFYWRAKLLGNTAQGFMNLVLGQSEVTLEDLEAEENRFRTSGEGSGVRGEGDAVQTQEQMEDGVSQ